MYAIRSYYVFPQQGENLFPRLRKRQIADGGRGGLRVAAAAKFSGQLRHVHAFPAAAADQVNPAVEPNERDKHIQVSYNFV